MKHFKEQGCLVSRSAGSHSFSDLVVINPKLKTITFIQCKPKNFSNSQKSKLEKEFAWLEDEFLVKYRVI